MEEIGRLIKIVSGKAEKNAYGVDFSMVSENPNLEELLFLGAMEGKFTTDDEAAKGLYDTDATDHRFRMLKSRLKSKLLNLLFLVDFKDSKDNISWQHSHECENHLQRARILLRSGELDMAEKQVNKALSISRECEFTNLTIESLRLMRYILSERCKPTDFYRVVEDINTMLQVQAKEDEAFNLYHEVTMNLRKSYHSRKNTLPEAGEAVKKLAAMHKATPTYNMFDKHYRLKLFYMELMGDFKGVVDATVEAEKQLADGKLNVNRFDVRFNYYTRTYAFLRAKDFENGVRTASAGMEHFDKDSANWFAHMENYMLLALHGKDYKLGADLIFRVERNGYFNELPEATKERWKILHAYLNFALPGESAKAALNFDKIYISLKEYDKENRNRNASILIIELLHHLKERNMDRVVDKMDGLVSFMKLHFGDPGQYPREKLFIKMLKAIISTNFDAEKASRKGKKYHAKLQDEVDHEDYFAEIEVLPYEHIWEHMVELLPNK